jgi:hypothetical protein
MGKRPVMYLQTTINDKLDHVYSSVIKGRKLTPSKLASILDTEFQGLGAKVKLQPQSAIGRYAYDIYGYYDPLECESKAIQLDLYFRARTPITFSSQGWKKFKFLFSTTLQHEMIHRWQQMKRGDLIVLPQLDGEGYSGLKYLADKDEIDARAHDIAMELSNVINRPKWGLAFFKHRYPPSHVRSIWKDLSTTRKQQLCVLLLKRYRKLCCAMSPTFNEYANRFRKKYPDIYNRLLKKTIKYLESPLCVWKE